MTISASDEIFPEGTQEGLLRETEGKMAKEIGCKIRHFFLRQISLLACFKKKQFFDI